MVIRVNWTFHRFLWVYLLFKFACYFRTYEVVPQSGGMRVVARSSLLDGKGFDNEFVRRQCNDRKFTNVSIYLDFYDKELYDREKDRNSVAITNIF